MEPISLSRLNEFIRRVITLNFIEPIWIIAELVQYKSNKGHFYLELAERTELNEIIAQSSAVIWKTNWTKIIAHFPEELLKEGNQFKFKIQVNYHPQFGLKLNVVDLDESFTLGEIAKQKQQTIARLVQEGLWQKNKSSFLPIAIKKIAVITSLSAAGKVDFESHLAENNYGYTFLVNYYPASMQGQRVVSDICTAIQTINKNKKVNFDCIVIIRGGGAKLDLIEFDQYEISKQIALSTLPILSGIGHHQDESITDRNAFLALKTPTAVADFIIERNQLFETKLISLTHTIERLTNTNISKQKESFQFLNNQIYQFFYQSNQTRLIKVSLLDNKLINALGTSIRNKQFQLSDFVHLFESNNPISILAKGYSLNFQNNKRIYRSFELDPNSVLETIFTDGKVSSKIIVK